MTETPTIGIDFGTTNSARAIVGAGESEIRSGFGDSDEERAATQHTLSAIR